MRVPGWMVGLGVMVWFAATAACSAGAFVSARQLQLDSVDSGLQLPDLPNFANLRPTETSVPTIVADAAPTNPSVTAAVAASVPPPSQSQPDDAASDAAPAAANAVTVADDQNALVRGALQRVGPRKITVLLLGIDQRSAVESADTEVFRTDTMIVVEIDPARGTAAMLSIPRDLYVPIPGSREARINVANVVGDTNGYPGGGPALAMKTVEANLGLEIDHFVLVNFDVFLRVVDTVAPSGVEICIPEPINDPFYPDEGYGFIEVNFEEGCQRLDSERLLQYARTRKTQGSDFDRARRQQQVILAVQREVVSAGGITNLVTRAPSLWQDLGNNIRTDLTFEEALDLALVSTTIDTDTVQLGTINNLHVTLAKDEDGQDILLPVPASISALIQDTFNPGNANLTMEELRERATEEGATVIIFNNTNTTGLAGSTRTWLNANAPGVPIVSVGNAETIDNANTVIKDYTGNPWTSRYLAQVMGLPRERILAGTDGLTSEDIAIMVGPDIEEILSE